MHDLDFYAKTDAEWANVAAIKEIAVDFGLDLFQPSPQIAPWHVQAEVFDGYQHVIVNFWPHKFKAQLDGERSVEGYSEVVAMLNRVVLGEEPVELVEPPF